MRDMSVVKFTKPVKSSSTKSTSCPVARAPSAIANAVHVAAYRSPSLALVLQVTIVVCAMAPSASKRFVTWFTRDACAPNAAYTHLTPVFFCAAIDVNPSSDKPVPGSPLTNIHCPRPTGASKSTALIPVTSGVVMGFLSSTLGGSRIILDESTVPVTIATFDPTISPSASTTFPNVDPALGPSMNSTLLASQRSPGATAFAASRITFRPELSTSYINPNVFGSR
mmetsp:Transcript_6349/g.14090  ORF Transcript_6349/g.14090 Transcript_6349/m.14090 type:complete len:225 (+) Transcript_6349:978-1652(+)